MANNKPTTLPYDKDRQFEVVDIFERQLTRGVCYYYKVIKEYKEYTDEVWIGASSCYLDSNKVKCCEQEKDNTRITLIKKKGEKVYIPSKLFQVDDYHAMFCSCKKCKNIWKEFAKALNDNTKIINSNPKKAGEVLTKSEFKERMGI